VNLLARYLTAAQLHMLGLALLALTAIHLVISILDKLRTFIAHGATTTTMMAYFGFGLPATLAEVLPFALLIATVVSLGTLSARSEITAMRAAGVSVFRLVIPLLGVGLACSLLTAWAHWGFIPRTNALAARTMETVTHQGGAVFSRDRIWFRTNGRTIFGIRSADMAGGQMWGIRILQTDGQGAVNRLITAQHMSYGEHGWELHRGQVVADGPDGLSIRTFDTVQAPLARPPTGLGEIAVPRRELSYRRLSAYIRRLKSDGYDATRYEMDLAQRLAFPFACLIMVLVAIPHGITPPRSHSLARGVGVSLVIGLLFWLLDSLAVALGRVGMLPPLAAAWLPVAVFAAYGAYRMLAIRQ